jgi:hypothetical protein
MMMMMMITTEIINKFHDINLNNYMIILGITGYLDFVQHPEFYGTHIKR